MGSMLAALAALLSRIRRWRERRRAWRRLAAIGERDLQDIGICRSDIAHHSLHDRGKPYLLP
ncbi:DUF1127 domain-containing protein [Bradyrhizobium erythrophlei]|uniref:DUF1127 domain-containing protein n=1 Tax=Bradyrhizobium erythrophlei TaxID=1437360 RepID=UPI0035EDBC5D